VEFPKSKVTLEIALVLFHRRALAVDGHRSATVLLVAGQGERVRGATEMRQTHGCHSLSVFAQRGLGNRHDLSRIERPFL